MKMHARLSREVEVYPIDEAFLDFGGNDPAALADHARTVRATVGRWTGIPVSVQVAPTKVLDKLANQVAKRDPACGGVSDLTAAPHWVPGGQSRHAAVDRGPSGAVRRGQARAVRPAARRVRD
jgi:hypothetical protein